MIKDISQLHSDQVHADALKEVSLEIMNKHKDKIESDIISLLVDLEYYKVEGKSKKLIVINGGQVDYKKVISSIELTIENLLKKLNIIKNLLKEEI